MPSVMGSRAWPRSGWCGAFGHSRGAVRLDCWRGGRWVSTEDASDDAGFGAEGEGYGPASKVFSDCGV